MLQAIMRPDAAPGSLQPIHHLMRLLPPLCDEKGCTSFHQCMESLIADASCRLFELTKVERNSDVTMRNFDCPSRYFIPSKQYMPSSHSLLECRSIFIFLESRSKTCRSPARSEIETIPFSFQFALPCHDCH